MGAKYVQNYHAFLKLCDVFIWNFDYISHYYEASQKSEEEKKLTVSVWTCQYSSWTVAAGLAVILEKNVGFVSFSLPAETFHFFSIST